MQTKYLVATLAGFVVITGTLVTVGLNTLKTQPTRQDYAYQQTEDTNATYTNTPYISPRTDTYTGNKPEGTPTPSPSTIKVEGGIQITPNDTTQPTPIPTSPPPTNTPTPTPIPSAEFELADNYQSVTYIAKFDGLSPQVVEKYDSLVILQLDEQTKLRLEVKGEAFEAHVSIVEEGVQHQQLGDLLILEADNKLYFTNKQPKTSGPCPVMEELIQPPCGFVEYMDTQADDIPDIVEIACIPSSPETKTSSLATCKQVIDKLTFRRK